MRLDDLHLWFLGNPAEPRYVGALILVAAGKGVSLHYGQEWLAKGFALSEDLPLWNSMNGEGARYGAICDNNGLHTDALCRQTGTVGRNRHRARPGRASERPGYGDILGVNQ
jgi:hypothetical protein